MLTRVGAYVQELFPELTVEPLPSQESAQALRRSDAVEAIRRNRADPGKVRGYDEIGRIPFQKKFVALGLRRQTERAVRNWAANQL
jgi:hypothetical protein